MEEREEEYRIGQMAMKIDADHNMDYMEQPYIGDLSPTSQICVYNFIKDLRSKKAYIYADDTGKMHVKDTCTKLEHSEDANNRNLEQRMSHIDVSKANLITCPKNKAQQDLQIEALLECIDHLKKMKSPSGVCLDKSKADPEHGKYLEGKNFIKTKEVLGKGGIAGDIVVVKDNNTNQEHALKTVMISSFRKEELKMWLDLGEEDFVPSLYIFYIKDNYIHFHMEKLDKVVSLRDVIDEHMNNIDSDTIRPLSLCILHGLLTAVNTIHDKNWTHRDLHAGNVLLQKTSNMSIDVKIIDFGMGKEKCTEGVKNDILNCFRLFSALYLGLEFDSIDDVQKNGVEKLDEITKYYQLSEEDRKEILQILASFIDVLNFKSDSEKLIQHVEGIISHHKINKEDILQYAASKLFPDKAISPPQSFEMTEDDNVDSGSERYSSVESTGSITTEFIDNILSELAIG